ncbi:MAG TPA: gliding motility-associated C-terminal domain-containing protein, partial [Cyclobacteriaceae bacterium]
TYNAVVTDANGCLSAAAPIIINNGTPITITSTSPTNATCFGVNDGSIDVTGVTGGTGTYTYSNDNGATFQAASLFASLAVGSYDMVVKDGNNCLSPAVTVVVGNNTVMSFTATPTAATCLGINDGSISIAGETGGVAPYSYSIDNGANFLASANFSSLAPGNYDVLIRDVNLCLAATSTIVVGNGSAITINTVVSNGTTCSTSNDGSIDITSVSGGTPPYMYSIDNGVTSQAASLFSSLLASNYDIVIMDNNGCLSASQVQLVAAGTSVTATVNNTDATCADNDGSITISGETGGVGPYQYSIDNGVSFQATGVFSGLLSGSYDVVVMEAGGCASAAQSITVNLPLNCTPTGNCATVVITPVATAATCSPTDGKIMFNITPATPTINNTGVRIDIVGTSTSNTGVSLTNFNDPLFTGLPIGTYDYTIEYGDPGCIKTGTVTVLLGPDVVDFTVAPNSVNCLGTAGGVILSNINGSSTADYTYEVIQTGTIVQTGAITQLESLGDVTVIGLGSGNFEIKLSQDQSATTSCTSPVQSALKPFTVTGPAASLDTLYVTKKISVPDLPTGSMIVGIEESLQEPYEVRLELTVPLFPGQVFAQDFIIANRNPLNLKIEYQAPNLFAGTYQLSLRDALGCRKDYLVNIAVDNNLMIPNIFTPNGDGVNEVFFIRNMPDATEVIVSNRWGKQVYASKNYQNDWDGGDIADGVYYYRINAGGQTYSGWVELLRGK